LPTLLPTLLPTREVRPASTTHKLIGDPLQPGRDRITYREGNFGLMVTAKGHNAVSRAGKMSRRMSPKPT
jgi:hypothetical protein